MKSMLKAVGAALVALALVAALASVESVAAAEVSATVLKDGADAKSAADAQAAVDGACRTVKAFKERLARAEVEEGRARAARAKTLASLAAKLKVSAKNLAVRVERKTDGETETTTVTLVGSD